MSQSIPSNPQPLPVKPGESHLEFRKMILGEPYLANDPYLDRLRNTYADLIYTINSERDSVKREEFLRGFIKFLGRWGTSFISCPFYCEYGFNITIGEEVVIGPNSTFSDVCPITIGDRTMIGPNVQIYTPSHPLSPEARNGLKGVEWAVPVTIGKDCWIGGGAIILPGVNIGDGVTVGAGSVVTKDVKSRRVVVGNPARVIKEVLADGTVISATS